MSKQTAPPTWFKYCRHLCFEITNWLLRTCNTRDEFAERGFSGKRYKSIKFVKRFETNMKISVKNTKNRPSGFVVETPIISESAYRSDYLCLNPERFTSSHEPSTYKIIVWRVFDRYPEKNVFKNKTQIIDGTNSQTNGYDFNVSICFTYGL